MKTITLLYLIVLSLSASAQNLYVRSFGSPKKPALVFLHGGPGYNAASFEATTAQALADRGFFVLLYDRRGEGRSKDPNAAYTYAQSVADLDSIISSFQLSRVSLIGHSFGGVIGTRYAAKFPKKTQALILMGAPIDLQESFRTMIRNSRQRAQERNDTTNLKFLAKLESMDTGSLMYSSMVFSQAMKNGLYSPKSRTKESQVIFDQIKADSAMLKLVNSMFATAAMGFFKNEQYTTLNLRPDLQALIGNGVKIFGIYGQEDGLYSAAQVQELATLIGAKNLKYIAGASHNVYMDQQAEFIAALKSWIKTR